MYLHLLDPATHLEQSVDLVHLPHVVVQNNVRSPDLSKVDIMHLSQDSILKLTCL